MKHSIQPAGWLFAAAAVLGCRETKSSEYVHTRDIVERVQVVATGADAAEVNVVLRTSGVNGSYVELAKGDTLEASAGTLSKAMKEISSGMYQTTLGTGAAVAFTVDFDRAEEPDASLSRGTPPLPFEIGAPLEGDTVSRSMEDLVVTWEAKEDGVIGAIHITGPCIFEYNAEVDRTAGGVTVAKGELTSLDAQKPEGCDIEVSVSFERDGEADPMLHPDSTFQGFQVRKVTIGSEP